MSNEQRNDRTHRWCHIFSTGSDGAGKSLDTIEQCRVCGIVRHSYQHNGGQTSPAYPRYFVRGTFITGELAECDDGIAQ